MDANTTNSVAPTYEQLQQRVKELEARDAAKMIGNSTYDVLPGQTPGKPPVLRLTLGNGTKAIVGGRRKWVGLVEEIKSGRLEKFLSEHTEIGN